MEKETRVSPKRSKLDEEVVENLDLVENLKMYEMMKDLKLHQPAAGAGKLKDSGEKKQ